MEWDTSLDDWKNLSSIPDSDFDFSRYVDSDGHALGSVTLAFNNTQAADLFFGDQNGKTSWKELNRLHLALKQDPHLVLRWRSPVCFLKNEPSCIGHTEIFDIRFASHTLSLKIISDSEDSALMWPQGTTFKDIYLNLVAHKNEIHDPGTKIAKPTSAKQS